MIFVSVGHHLAAPGARFKRFVEHDEARVWQDLLLCRLGGHGMEVPVGTLRTKVGFINSRTMPGDVAIEIHFNAALDEEGNNVGRGCETLYYPGSERGKTLAEVCHAPLSEIFPPDRGVKEGWYRGDKKKGPYFFLSRTRCPAVILEPEFVHRHDVIQDNRAVAVRALADALIEFYGEAEDV